MTTEKQRKAARKNVKKAQAKGKSMSAGRQARSQPQGRGRKSPGSTGKGDYYHVQVRPKSEFVSFRTQDVGKRGHIQRVAGKRASGSWATVKWLIGKDDAHLQAGRLVADTKAARDVIKQLGSAPVRTRGDQFKARPRPNVAEAAKPTAAQRRARSANIKKAQSARHKRS